MRRQRGRGEGAGREGETAPTMLEVIPVPTVVPTSFPGVSESAGVSLSLPGGAELRFEALPPARWVAELVAELARC